MTYITSTQRMNLIFINLLYLIRFSQRTSLYGNQLYNGLPPQIKDHNNNIKKFESDLLDFLHQHTFYTIDEYFDHQQKQFDHKYFTHFHIINFSWLQWKVNYLIVLKRKVYPSYIIYKVAMTGIMSLSNTITVPGKVATT